MMEKQLSGRYLNVSLSRKLPNPEGMGNCEYLVKVMPHEHAPNTQTHNG